MGLFGDAIRKARDGKGWTQEQLARIVGRKQATISQYEIGIRAPATAALANLCKALDLEPSELLDLITRDVVERSVGVTDVEDYEGEDTEYDARIPVVGHIAEGAAKLSWLDETTPSQIGDESVALNVELQDGNAFAIRMKGDSMSPALHDGDIAIISPKATIRSGDEALVHCKKRNSYLKAVFPKESVTILRSHNPNYEDIVLENSDIVRMMKVIDIRRKP